MKSMIKIVNFFCFFLIIFSSLLYKSYGALHLEAKDSWAAVNLEHSSFNLERALYHLEFFDYRHFYKKEKPSFDKYVNSVQRKATLEAKYYGEVGKVNFFKNFFSTFPFFFQPFRNRVVGELENKSKSGPVVDFMSLSKMTYYLKKDITFFMDINNVCHLKFLDYVNETESRFVFTANGQPRNKECGFKFLGSAVRPSMTVYAKLLTEMNDQKITEWLWLLKEQGVAVDSDMPDAAIFTYHYDFGKIAAQKTALNALSLTLYYKIDQGKTRAVNYTYSNIYNILPSAVTLGGIFGKGGVEGAIANSLEYSKNTILRTTNYQ